MTFIDWLFHSKAKQVQRSATDPVTQELKVDSGASNEMLEAQMSVKEAEPEVYEILEREILPAKIICPDCGGITLEGLEFCDKCGGELQ